MSERLPSDESSLIPKSELPEPQPERTPDNLNEVRSTLEQKESERVAQGKLEKLLSPEFNNFGLRFVNTEDYRRIVERQSFGEGGSTEVYEIKNNLFSQFKNKREMWGEDITWYTNWSHSALNAFNSNRILAELRRIHAEAQTSSNVKDIRSVVIERFKNYLSTEYEKDWDYTKLDAAGKTIVHQFLNNPNASPSELRAVINTLSYAPHILGKEDGEYRQYHIALIFSPAAISNRKSHWNMPNWMYLKDPQTKQYTPQSGLLGAISVMPNKEILQELTELSSRAAKFAHPIFNRSGNVIYPRQSTETIKQPE